MKSRVITRSCVWLFVLLATVCGEPMAAESIRFERVDNHVFINGADVAAAMELDFKIVHPQRLVTFCGRGENGICIPVRLTEENHRHVGTDVLVAASVLERALRCRISDKGETVTVARQTVPIRSLIQDSAPAYNAAWGQDRGFRQGQTLPDIPLVDLKGDEVRFSQFLGKRYILYCWASW